MESCCYSVSRARIYGVSTFIIDQATITTTLVTVAGCLLILGNRLLQMSLTTLAPTHALASLGTTLALATLSAFTHAFTSTATGESKDWWIGKWWCGWVHDGGRM